MTMSIAMSTEINRLTENSIERVFVSGDLSVLTPEQRIAYYLKVCESLGLNPMTRPFEYLKLSGRLVLYARRDATDQLRRVHGVSIEITDRARIDDVYIVTARAVDRDGRFDTATGAVDVGGLKGEALANAMMRAETKAKRRVTLSICGLGVLDETEVESVSDAVSVRAPQIESPAPEALPDARARLAALAGRAKEAGVDEALVERAREAYRSRNEAAIAAAIAALEEVMGADDEK